MIIQSILKELEVSEHPVAKALHKSASGRAICIGFKKDMELKEHKAHLPTTLVILDGSIVYKEGEKETTLNKYDEYPIPVKITHSVKAQEQSLLMLIQG